MQTIKEIFLLLALILTCFLSASALSRTGPENRTWEIFGIGYDAVTVEVTDLSSRTEGTEHVRYGDCLGAELPKKGGEVRVAGVRSRGCRVAD